MKLRPLLVLMALACSYTLRADPEVFPVGLMGPDSQRPIPVKQARPVYPAAMRQAGKGGHAVIEFIVDLHGDVQQAHVVHSSAPDFEQPALTAVQQWKFKPGLIHGQPVYVRMQVPIVFSSDSGDPSVGFQGPPMPLPAASEIFDIARVDRPPLAQFQARPVYPPELQAAKKAGSATIDFIVDPHGIVAWSQVKSATDPAFGASALAAVTKWKFKPALKNGVPVFVHVLVPIHFGTS